MKLPELSESAAPEFSDAASCKAWLQNVPLANVAAAQGELLGQLAERQCTAQLMVMSGYHPELLNSSQRLGSNYALDMRGTLRKPFGVAELTNALHELN